MENKKITIATHNGSFHSDDIFGVATLCLLLQNDHDLSIVRSRDMAILSQADYVVDVGGEYNAEKNRFDHHQNGVPPRLNGVPYAASGLVWKKFGSAVCGSQTVADFIEKKIIYPIDARDNGIDISKPTVPGIVPYELRDIVGIFKATWKEDKSVLYERFIYLVSVAQEILKREIKFATDLVEGREAIRRQYEASDNHQLLVLDKHYPFEGMGPQLPDLLMVVYPDEGNGNWCLECERDFFETYKSRIYLPESWAGKTNADLEEESGVSGSIFCHKARFFAVAKTKEAAIKMAEIAIEKAKNQK